MFATHRLPEVPVSDNGPAFTATEFLECNWIKHSTSVMYHPLSDGLAEQAVQTVKEGLRKLTGPLREDPMVPTEIQSDSSHYDGNSTC